MQLPDRLSRWFEAQGWTPRPHQLALLSALQQRESTLLIAPTGAGKTLAGFLPSLVELSAHGANKSGPSDGLHTLYISPLKALAVDIQRNLLRPVEEAGLDIKIETRTGDTPPGRRQRQRLNPPDMLLTTPEQLALMLSHGDADRFFCGLRTIVLDELHALVTSKRGDLLSLALARLWKLAPDMASIGLSATVARPSELQAYLVRQPTGAQQFRLARLVKVEGGARPEISILHTGAHLPWSGHSARHALGEVYEAICKARLALIFVNTRSQAEFIFQDLWHMNDDNLAIGLHHGSLDVQQRRKVERAMAEGLLRAVVCTSTLDLGIDWGEVDLVVQIGAPKGASRFAQRIGRANHRLDEPSRALLVPANRFEVLESQAALEAAAEGVQDTPPLRVGGLDVLAQHVLGTACSAPFDADALYREVTSAVGYRDLTRSQFDAIVEFVANGGYALRSYERFARLRRTSDGLYRISHPRIAQQYRLNVGTIVEAPMLKVRAVRPRRARPLAGGRVLGEIEEWFIEQLVPGDTFLFAGQVLKFEGLRENSAFVSRTSSSEPKSPSAQGGKFPLSTYLAARVRAMLAARNRWDRLPGQVCDWLELQARHSIIPAADEVLVETFPRGGRFYIVCYPFEGRLAHQTLAMLMTRRLERARLRPVGFVATEYAIAINCLRDVDFAIGRGQLTLADLFDTDMLGDDLDAWLAQSSLTRRTFRTCAVIGGLIERRHPGQEKTGRQINISSDLIYDVLRQHDPGHILLQAAWADAASGLLDIGRLGDFLSRICGRIRHKSLSQVSPLAVPVMLEVGRESVAGEASEALLREAAQQLIEEATHRGDAIDR